MTRTLSKKWLSALAACGIVAGIQAAGAAAPVSWNADVNGNWNTASNWNPNGVPGSSSDVTLGNFANAYTVTLDTTPSISSLTVDSNASLVTTDGTSLTTGSLVLNGGFVNLSSGGKTFTVNGSATIGTGGEINVSSTFSGATTLTITGSLDNAHDLFTSNIYEGGATANNIVNVNGTLTNEATGVVQLYEAGDTLNVNSLANNGALAPVNGAIVNITGGGNGITDIVSGASVSNGGTINVINGGSSTNGLAKLTSVEGFLSLFNGQNTAVTPTGGTLAVSSTGTINLSSSATATSLTINGSLNNSNIIETGNYYEGYTEQNNVITVTGTFTNNASGTVRLQDAGDTMNAATLVNNGNIVISPGAILDITGGGSGITDISQTASVQDGGTINVGTGGSATNGLAKLTSVEGFFNLSDGKTSTITPIGGTLTISSTGNFNVSSGATPTNLTISGNLANSYILNISGNYDGFNTQNNTLTVTGTFTNNSSGTVRIEASGDTINVGTLANSGDLIVNPGAILNITGGGSGVTDISQTAQVQIDGAFNVINSSVSTSALAKLTSVEGFLNLGNGVSNAITPTGGTLTISSTGNFNVSSGAAPTSLTISGNLANSNILNISGNYDGFNTQNNTLTVTGTFTNNSNGTVRIEATGDTMNVGALANSGDLIVYSGATLNITGGGSGVTDISQTAQVQIDGAFNVINSSVSTSALAKLTSVEGFLNLGNGVSTAITPTGGTLTISSTGNLNVSSGATPTSLTISGNLANSNILNISGNYDGFPSVNNTLTITGTFTNNSSGAVRIEATGDTMNVGALANSGDLIVYTGATLNITGGGSGITDIPQSAQVQIGGTFNVINSSVATSALAKLTSVEGFLNLSDGVSNTITPIGGTLTISSTGNFNVSAGPTPTSVTINGNLVNSNIFNTSGNYDGYLTPNNSVAVTGAFTNNSAATVRLEGPGDVLSVGSMVNNNNVYVYSGASLKVSGDLTDNGAITLNINPGNGPAILQLSGGTLGGAGTVTLSNSDTNAEINGSLTQAAGHTIQGQGLINAAISNLGTINANVSGGTIALTGGLTQYSSGTLSAGTYEVSQNAKLDLGTATITTIGANASVILSGTAAAMPQIDFLPDVAGTVTANQGTFELLSSRSYSATGAFSNSGLLQLAGGTFAAGGGITNSASGTHTIEGFGTISSTLTNQGLVTSNVSGDNLVLAGMTTNTGSLVATSGGSIQIVPGLLTNLSGTTLTGGTYEADAGSTLNITGTITTNNATVILSGTGSVFAPINSIAVNNGSFEVEAGRSFTTLGAISGTGSVDVGAGSTLNVSGGFNQAGATTIEGAMSIAASAVGAGPGNRNPNATTNVLGSLTIVGGTTPTGTLNLNNNIMIVKNGGAAGRNAAQADIAFARNGGNWNQPGITSSNAKATFASTGVDATTLGVVLDSDLPIPYTTFSGKAVGPNDLLIAYTYGGDANLDGTINGNDYFQIDRGFLNHYTGWVNGDFNYDGSVNGNDYFIIDSNFINQSGQLAASEILAHAAEFGPSYLSQFTPAQLAVIGLPEPASLALLGLGALGLLARRRR